MLIPCALWSLHFLIFQNEQIKRWQYFNISAYTYQVHTIMWYSPFERTSVDSMACLMPRPQMHAAHVLSKFFAAVCWKNLLFHFLYLSKYLLFKSGLTGFVVTQMYSTLDIPLPKQWSSFWLWNRICHLSNAGGFKITLFFLS